MDTMAMTPTMKMAIMTVQKDLLLIEGNVLSHHHDTAILHLEHSNG